MEGAQRGLSHEHRSMTARKKGEGQAVTTLVGAQSRRVPLSHEALRQCVSLGRVRDLSQHSAIIAAAHAVTTGIHAGNDRKNPPRSFEV